MTTVHLEISSYRGSSLGAVHYYGKLRGEDPAAFMGVRHHDLNHPLTEAEATARNSAEIEGGGRFRYRVGALSYGFDTRDEIIALAVQTYKVHFPDAT